MSNPSSIVEFVEGGALCLRREGEGELFFLALFFEVLFDTLIYPCNTK